MKNLWKSAAWMLLLAAPLFVSCEENDNLPKQKENTETQANDNANSTKENSNYSRLEFPHLKTDGNNLVLVHTTSAYGVNFAVEWDCDKKAQRWTCYEMDASNSVKNWNRNNWDSTSWGGDPFQEDKDIPEQYRTKLSDYRGSGYDRGHICPSADRLNSQEANEQTFYLSNMQPQVNGFNVGVWSTMESQLRNTWNTSKYRDILYVCKGGTIDNSSQIAGYTSSKLIVPKYFFAAILAVKDGQYKAIGLWFEHKANNDKSLANYVVSIDELEKLTGIDFFCNLPDKTENTVEAASKTTMLSEWGL
jgi:endonuclease G, mitochondrial